MERGFLNGLREMLGVECPADVRAATMHFIGAVSQELIKPINEAWKTAMQGELTKLAASKATEDEPALLCAMAKVTLTKLGVDGPLAATAAATAVAAAAAAEASEAAAAAAAAAVGSASEASAAAAATVAAEAAGGSDAAAAKAASLLAMAKVKLMKLGVPTHAASFAAKAVAEVAAAEAAMEVAAAAVGSATKASAWAAAKVAAEAAAANAANAAGLAEAADGDDWFVEPEELSQLGNLLLRFIKSAEAGADAAKVERWKSSGALYVCVFLNGTGHNATDINEFWQIMNLPADRKSGFARLLKKL